MGKNLLVIETLIMLYIIEMFVCNIMYLCVGAWVRGCVGAWVRGCVGA